MSRYCCSRMRVILLLVFVSSGLIAGAQYSGPESVEYDAVGDRYFISNTGSGIIKQRSQAGVVTDFVSVSPAPYGLEIKGDTLFACSGGSVKGYLLSNASPVFNLNLGGTFLNGITTDGTYLYVTDFGGQEIFRVDPTAGTFSSWVASTGGTPNGIVYAPEHDALLVAYWGGSAMVRAYDRLTASIAGTVSTTLTNIDGITLDCDGMVLIASWSPDRITRFEWGILSPTFEDLQVPGLNNPADIDFDDVHDRVCIPNAAANTVTLHEVTCTTGIHEIERSALKVIPNPTTGLIRIEPAFNRDEPYILLDGRGLMIGGGTLRHQAQLDISALPAGAYVLDFTRVRKQVRVVKE